VGHLENGLDDSTASMRDQRDRYGHLSHTHDQKEAQALPGRLDGGSGSADFGRRHYQGHVGDDYER